MAKVKSVGVGCWRIKVPCPCRSHMYDARWVFNGDMEKPTFYHAGTDPNAQAPYSSMLIRTEIDGKPYLCHSFVTNGMIDYKDDGTTHEFRGQVLPLEDIE